MDESWLPGSQTSAFQKSPSSLSFTCSLSEAPPSSSSILGTHSVFSARRFSMDGRDEDYPVDSLNLTLPPSNTGMTLMSHSTGVGATIVVEAQPYSRRRAMTSSGLGPLGIDDSFFGELNYENDGYESSQGIRGLGLPSRAAVRSVQSREFSLALPPLLLQHSLHPEHVLRPLLSNGRQPSPSLALPLREVPHPGPSRDAR